MRVFVGVIVAFGLLGSSAQARTREARHLAPSSAWVVDYADDTCRLARSFGDGRPKVSLVLEELEPGDEFHTMFVGDTLSPRSKDATLRFGPTENEDKVTALPATTAKNVRAILLGGSQRIVPLTAMEKLAWKDAADRNVQFDPPSIGAARERAVTWLQLGKALSFDLVLDTGPMDEPLAALRACSWDMVKTWGLDVEQQKHVSRKVRPAEPSRSWFSVSDYPSRMLRGGYEANVNFRVLVDETGKASSCKIQSSTRPKEFDDVVCAQVMKRARFNPALDAAGKPVKSFWRQTVNFRIAS